jgi:hypothetical protein
MSIDKAITEEIKLPAESQTRHNSLLCLAFITCLLSTILICDDMRKFISIKDVSSDKIQLRREVIKRI